MSSTAMTKPELAVDFCDFGARFFKAAMPLYQLLRQRYPLDFGARADFVFYSNSGHCHRVASGVRIFVTGESDNAPDWRVCDYALTPVRRGDSRHLYFPAYALVFETAALIQPPGDVERLMAEKKKFCAFMHSYRNAKTELRWRFYEKLSRRKPVDSGGRAGNNLGRVVPFGVQPTVDFLRPYKFFIAFENKRAPGYTTDRLLFALAAGCVPIYYGAPDVAVDFNPKRFLNYHDYPSEEALIERILEIDRDDALLRQYLSEPPFHDNRPTPYFDPEYYLAFFEKVFNTPIEPMAVRNMGGWRRWLGRWTLAKRDKPHPMHWGENSH